MSDFWVLLAGCILSFFTGIILTGQNAIESLSRVDIDVIDCDKNKKEKMYWFYDNVLLSTLSLKVFFVQIFTLSIILLTTFFFVNIDMTGFATIISLVVCLLLATILIAWMPLAIGKTNPIKVVSSLCGLLFFVIKINKFLVERFVARKQNSATEVDLKANLVRDLKEVVDGADGVENIEEEDREIIESVFELGDTIVREVMVPRIDMITVSPEESIRRTLALFVKSGYSRIPVVGSDIDDIYGVVYLKDILRKLHYNPNCKEENVREVMRQAHFVPETIKTDNLLRRMQQELFHIAIVVDEYGGTSGLVTIEDLLEVLVGDLVDEHDKAIIEPEEISKGMWKVPARFPINELDEILDIEIEDDDVDTIAGLLAKAIGKVPLPGARGSIYGLNMVAQDAVGRRKQVGSIVISKQVENT